MKLIRTGTRWVFDCTYHQKDIAKGAGFRWDGDKWYTDSAAIACQLREYADDELSDELDTVYAEVIAERYAEAERNNAAIAEIRDNMHARQLSSSSVSTVFHIDAGNGNSFLPYQQAGIEQIIQRPNILLADEMGLGKTAQAIGAINGLPDVRRVLVIVTPSLLENWRREFMKFSTRDLSIGFASTKKIDDADIIIAPYSMFSTENAKVGELKSVVWDMLVLDEAHYVKNFKSKRTKRILGERNDDGIQANRYLFMTGTPMMNRPDELFSILAKLCPIVFPSYDKFVSKFCDQRWNGYGNVIVGGKNMNELNGLMRGTVMIRRAKADVLTELPPKRRQTIHLKVQTAAERQALKAEAAIVKRLDAVNDFADMIEAKRRQATEEELKKWLKKLEKMKSDDEYKNALAAVAIARKNTAISKLPRCIDVIKDVLDEDPEKKIIVFAHHREIIDGIMIGLRDYGPVSITGRVEKSKRQDIVDQFQTDARSRVFVGSIHACGEGITLTAASHVAFIELDWTPAKMSQCEDRAHRIGQRDSVLVQHLLLEGSYDEKMAEKLIHKQNMIDAAVNSCVVADVIIADEPDPTVPDDREEGDEDHGDND